MAVTHYRVNAAAEELGISRWTLKKLEKDSVIPPLPRDYNGHRRIPKELLDQIREVLIRRAALRKGRYFPPFIVKGD